MTSTSEILTRIETHCTQHKIAESTFGRLAVNDGKLVARLRSGGSINLRTLMRIEEALAAPAPAEVAA